MATSPPTTPFTHTPPTPFTASSLTLISQGAEALLYRTSFLTPTGAAALKYRPPKPYRHATLDRRLTRARILAEARVLQKCAAARLDAPRLLGLAPDEGWIALGWVEGRSVRDALRGMRGEEGREARRARVLRLVGRAVGGLHGAGICHGDLTSSNMMVAPAGDGAEEGERIVLIDFGLAQTTVADEDRAVDLYVLERAFGSTHPELEDEFAREVLKAYGESYKGAKIVLKRLEEVRMRGRKKSMLG